MSDPKAPFARRRGRLREKLAAKGLPGIVISQAANRYYLSGFELHDTQCNETAGWLLVTAQGDDLLMTDPRYEEAALSCMGKADRVFIYKAKRLEAVADKLKSLGMDGVGFEAKGLSVFEHEALATAGLDPVAADGLVEGLRLKKDPAEMEAIRASARLNHELMAWLPEVLLPGRTEAEVAWDIERFFREHGAQSMAFPSIVAVGKNAALPHAIPGAEKLRAEELVLVDTGCRVADYCSDQTRTFWVGEKPSARFTEMLDRVREAQRAALDILAPGLPLAETYHTARRVFEECGVAEYFTHSLGHGVGLETHEGPSLSSLSQGVLEPGMVVTVEPGLYYPEWGGARWEHMAYITEDGKEVL